MSNYVKATNFTAKDSLPSGNAGKIVKGAEIDTELTAVASAVSSKADINSPALTGTPTAPTAIAGTNTTQLATTAFAAAAAAAAFPVGGIIMWSGTIAAIPTGWALCNGSNGTPDLRNRFIIGAHSDNAGVANTTITGGNTLTGGSKDAIVVSHDHTFSATTASNGAHQHIIGISGGQGSVNLGNNLVGDPGQRQTSDRYSESAGAHTHTVSGTTASAGSSGTNANLPPYYALAFIMKT
jgi:hypothetical protein